MKRNLAIAMVFLASGAVLSPVAPVVAHAANGVMRPDDVSARSYRYRRAPNRVRVYRSLGPNSVRVCNAYYVQEYRPSGTVITPRMNCYWRG